MDRSINLQTETDYGIKSGNKIIHHPVSKNKVSLDTKPVRPENSFKRGLSRAIPGQYTSKISTDFTANLELLAIYLRGVLGDEYLSGDEEENDLASLEIFGSSNEYLPSYTICSGFDNFTKEVKGAILDSFKLDVKTDGFLNCTAEWIGQIEEKVLNTQEDNIEIPGDYLSYLDLDIKLGDSEIEGIINSISLEIKNNINSEVVQGLGSRKMQAKPPAGNREISISAETVMHPKMQELINAAEYGEEGLNTPSKCKLYQTPIEILIKPCGEENTIGSLFFPSCEIIADYEVSGKDAINVKFDITPTETKTIKTQAGIEILTDIYVKMNPKSGDKNWFNNLLKFLGL